MLFGSIKKRYVAKLTISHKPIIKATSDGCLFFVPIIER